MTPGPWHVGTNEPAIVFAGIHAVATVHCVSDAVAITQVPAMVEALHKLCRAVDGTNVSPGAVDRAYKEAQTILAALREGGAL